MSKSKRHLKRRKKVSKGKVSKASQAKTKNPSRISMKDAMARISLGAMLSLNNETNE